MDSGKEINKGKIVSHKSAKVFIKWRPLTYKYKNTMPLIPRTNIVINLEVEGLHMWLDAKTTLPEVAYLSYPHLHKFKIQVKKKTETGNNDRPIEIISLKHELDDYFRRNFWDTTHNCHNFNNRSCELIALDLMEAYDLDYVQVLEDGYWGAEVTK